MEAIYFCSIDEAYVMFAMFPEKAALVTLIIFFVGILAGYISNKIPFFVNISNQLNIYHSIIYSEAQRFT